MINKITILLLILGLLTISQGNLLTQNPNAYQNLTFLEFLNQKVENDTNLIKQLYLNLKLPLQARMYEMEGVVEFRIFNHGPQKLEVSQIGMEWPFTNGKDELEKAFTQTKINRTQPFVTTLFVNFGYDDNEIWKSSKDYYLGLYNNNTISIMNYKVPDKWLINGAYQYVAGTYKHTTADYQSKLILQKDSTFVLTNLKKTQNQLIPNGSMTEVIGRYIDQGGSIKLYPTKSRLGITTIDQNLKVVKKQSVINGNFLPIKTYEIRDVIWSEYQNHQDKKEIELEKKVRYQGIALQNENHFFFGLRVDSFTYSNGWIASHIPLSRFCC